MGKTAKKPVKLNGPWLKDPRKAREGEVIGGGWFVFRRGDGTGRIRPAHWPFEHASKEAAEAEARKLAEANPGLIFNVVGVANSFLSAAEPAEAQDAA